MSLKDRKLTQTLLTFNDFSITLIALSSLILHTVLFKIIPRELVKQK